MSSNNNARNARNARTGNNGQRDNRIRGPTSALSSFLREHNIRVENRSRREHQERRRVQQQQHQGTGGGEDTGASAQTAQPNGDTTSSNVEPSEEQSQASENTPIRSLASASSAEEGSTAVLYTPATRRRTATAQRQAIINAALKRKKQQQSDDDDEDYENQAGPSTPQRRPGRTQVLFCEKCKNRFARPFSDIRSDSEPVNMCPNCVQGKSAESAKRPAPKKKRIGKETSTNQVRTLQDICINIVAKNIDDVEALGEISFENLDKLAKIICRNRKLTNQTARLFFEPHMQQIHLYDCTNVDETGLLNVAQFCPRLRSIHLIYCGHMTTKVIEYYAKHLHALRALQLSGAYLVDAEGWKTLFESLGSRLETFGLAYSFRFTDECIQSLADNCVNMRHLRLARLSQMNDEWLSCIGRLTKLEALALDWPSNEEQPSSEALTAMLSKIGRNLKELSLRGCVNVDDQVLLEGILPHCPNLEKLNLTECQELTTSGVQTFFQNSKTTLRGHGFKVLDFTRCIHLEDDAFKAMIHHSGKSLEHLSIHSWDNLTASALEKLADGDEGDDTACRSLSFLDCGFVRSMDDFVLQKLVMKCEALNHIKVWGCHLLTAHVPGRLGLKIEGRELV